MNKEKKGETNYKVLTPELIEGLKKLKIQLADRQTREKIEENFTTIWNQKFKDGLYDDYKNWIATGYTFYLSAYTLEDFLRITKDDEIWKKEAEGLWEDFKAFPKEDKKTYKDYNSMILESNVKRFESFLKKIMLGGKQLILNLETNTFMRLKDAKEHFTEDKWFVEVYEEVGVAKNVQMVKKNGFELWFKNPKFSYQEVVDDAELPYGHNDINGVETWNRYEAPEFKDGSGTYTEFFNHIKENVCNGNIETYNFVKKWIFHLIKYPNSKNGIVLALKGEQGTGKSFIYTILSMFFAEGYTKTINTSEELMNRFNSAYANNYLISLEEAVFAGTKKSGAWGKLKDLITNKKITLEKKGLEPMVVDNNLHIMITTNEDWVAPKEVNDRRYLILRTNNNRLNDQKYFQGIIKDMKEGGLKKLYETAIADASITREMVWNIPETKESIEDLIYTASQTTRLWIRLVEDYENCESYTSNLFGKTKADKLFFKSAEMYPFYSKINISADRGRKETKNLFGENYKTAGIQGEQNRIKVYQFEDIQEVKDCICKNAFGGVNVFDDKDLKDNIDMDEIMDFSNLTNVLQFRN